jgi:hypothetical protein
MIRALLIGTGIALLGIAAVPRAAAAGPGLPFDCGGCEIPETIEVMGVNAAGQPDPAAGFEVVIRDLAQVPIEGAEVAVYFGTCPDLRVSEQSSGLVNPTLGDQVLDCPTRTIRGITDANGRVRLSVLGAAVNAAGGSAAGAGEDCARFYVDGVLIGFATVHIYDQNGAASPAADGVEISDLARWLADFGSGVYVGRSDYAPGSPGVVSIDDLAHWLRRFGSGDSAGGSLGSGFCP